MRTVSLISCILHNLLFIFCLALVGAGPMVFNFLQAAWIYSVFLTMRQREMVVYLLLVLGQIAQCLTMMLKDREVPLGAFQSGGLIGNCVACCLLLWFNGRAFYLFHESGGLRGRKGDITEPLIAPDDNEQGPDADPLDVVADPKKKKDEKAKAK